MGCCCSKGKDIHPNVFKVMNVDDSGNNLSPGQLKITDNDLILYQGKKITQWPLRCLRRYGFDAELFSFESGRRCSTGPGIYAFRCNRAEQMFNLLQERIQVRNNSNEDRASHDLPLPPSNGTPCAPQVSANYLEPRIIPGFSNRLKFPKWLNSSTAHTPLTALTESPLPAALYINGNITDEDIAADRENCNGTVVHPYVNVNVDGSRTPDPETVNSYINVDLSKTINTSNNNIRSDTVEDSLEPSPMYQNVLPGSLSPTSVTFEDLNILRGRHYYNLEPGMVKTTLEFGTKINYIELELDDKQSDPNSSPSSLHSNSNIFDNKPSERYVTIDFDRTVALSQTRVSRASDNSDNDKEGVRKTRHNSVVTASDMNLLAKPTRGSSSLSD